MSERNDYISQADNAHSIHRVSFLGMTVKMKLCNGTTIQFWGALLLKDGRKYGEPASSYLVNMVGWALIGFRNYPIWPHKNYEQT